MWRSGTRFVNWYVVDGGAAGLTVVDAGLPGYASRVGPALERIGRRLADVRAVLLTHGHVDHTGTADLFAGAGAAVYLHPEDRALAEDPKTNRTDAPLLRYAWWPATAAFIAHAVREGATRPRPMPASSQLADGERLDVPGRPTVTHLPGHTAGSCAFLFPEHDVIVVGDALCTTNAFSGASATPRLQTRGSNADSAAALASLERLSAVEAQIVLPGHGNPWRGGTEAAVASVRRVGCS